MPSQLLTQLFIDAVTCSNDRTKCDYFDTKTKGLLLKVFPSGLKVFYLRFQNHRGKFTEKKLAKTDAGILRLADARVLAQQLLSQIAMGVDPFGEKEQLKLVPTLAQFIADAYLPYAKVNKRSWKTDDSLIRNHILPNFGHVLMDSFTKQHFFGFIAEHRETHAPASVNRVIILLRFLFNCAIRWEVVGVRVNPTAGVPLLAVNNQKERYLTESEAQALFKSVAQSENKLLQYIIAMLILTGTRKREVLDAKWSEFDLERRIWRIGMSKSGKARHVPISDGVIALLEAVPRIDDCAWVFANPNTLKPFDNVFYSWDTARKRAGLADVRIHDLRHSFASFLVNSGRSLYEVQKILGHTQIKTTQRYAHLANDTLLDAANQVSKLVPLVAVMPSHIEAVPLVRVSSL
jgi:integrase